MARASSARNQPPAETEQFSASEIVVRKLDDLKPYPRNPRTHSADQVESLAAMIQEFGFTQPILVDEKGTILAGHGRAMALRKLKYFEAPTIVRPGLTDDQKRAIVIADNQASALAGWDNNLLILELGELKQANYNIELTGFRAVDLVSFIAAKDAEENPALPPGNLAEKFGIAPFSTLNAREGWWQDRKRLWLSLGIKSELGRGENLLKFSDTINEPDPKKRAARKAKASA